MQIGIVGIPNSGKSTIFATLLQHKEVIDGYKGKKETEKGIVKVPDERLEKLSGIFHPEKTTNATIEYIKVPGLDSEQAKSGGLPARFLANLKTVDTILHVVRAFENPLFPHPFNRIDPKTDIEFVNSEFLLSDLTVLETRIEKLEKSLSKIQNDKDKKELGLLSKCHGFLEQEKPLREMDFTAEEEKQIRGFQFLTLKPMLYVININENNIADSENIIKKYKGLLSPSTALTALCAKIEREVSELDSEDQKEFLEHLGIHKPALHMLIQKSFELLGLISFFTVGEDECRSWTIYKGNNAQKAGSAIHSDIERGFIRASIVSYRDFIENKSLKECKIKGVLGLEGKEYIVQDGDIIEFRFNV